MIIAPLATLLGTVLGTAVGLLMGYFRGLVDDVFGRFVEAFLALPVVVTGVIALSTLGRSNLVLIIVIGLLFTPLIARTVRAAVLQERELEYVAAARLRGESAPYIMFAEILPNVFAPVTVEFTVRLAYAIFAILDLTFLGLGVQPPLPSWGLMISEARTFMFFSFWLIAIPGTALALLVLGINLLGDGLRDVSAPDGWI
jgi:peptide/nickel transport system permease protein